MRFASLAVIVLGVAYCYFGSPNVGAAVLACGGLALWLTSPADDES